MTMPPIGPLILVLILGLPLAAGHTAAAETHHYTAATNVGAAGLKAPPAAVCAAGCTDTDVCCIGGFDFVFPGPSIVLEPRDTLWGSHTGLMVCLADAQGRPCGGPDQTAGPRCGPMAVHLIDPTTGTRGHVFVFTLLVDDTLDVCGATEGTVKIDG